MTRINTHKSEPRHLFTSTYIFEQHLCSSPGTCGDNETEQPYLKCSLFRDSDNAFVERRLGIPSMLPYYKTTKSASLQRLSHSRYGF